MILALVLALGIGISLGMLGGGGSILTLPILVYVLHLEAKPAVATSLFVVGITSVAALVPHARAGRVRYKIGLAFGAASMTGAFVGGKVSHFLPSKGLLLAFAVVMLVTALAMMRPRRAAPAALARPWGRILAVGFAVGILTGILGAGGGFVIVPALALLCGLEMPAAVATSVVIIAINSLAGFVGYVGVVPVDFKLAGAVTAAAVVGSVIGAALSSKVRPDTLRGAFAWLVLTMSAFMLGREAHVAAGALALGVGVGVALYLRRAKKRATAAAEAPRPA